MFSPSSPLRKVFSAMQVATLVNLLAAPSAAAEPLNIVVTLPVLKDFAEQVGGEHVRVTSLLSGYENEHTYSPKPSDLVAIRKARLVFEVGIGLEGWISGLVKNAGNPSLLVVTTSKGIGLIRDHAAHMGHHAEEKTSTGNPHVWLDPENAATMVRQITEALSHADPQHASVYRGNQARYLRTLDDARRELSERFDGLADRRIVVHHAAWPYFARRFKLEIVGVLQSQPGAEPSAMQLQSLVKRIRKDRVKVIVSEIQLNQKLPEMIARETGARVVVLTTLPGGLPGTDTYLDMLRYNVLQLVNALEQG